MDLLSSSGHLRSRSGLGFSIELKFNFFELEFEVGRLVWYLVVPQIVFKPPKLGPGMNFLDPFRDQNDCSYGSC